MTAVTTSDGTTVVEEHGEHSDAIYWKVFAFLFAMTALEVSTELWPESMHKVTASALIVMMVIKFGVVAWFFMHLKDDNKILGRVFFAGATLAIGVYLAALGSMLFFENSSIDVFNDPPRTRDLPPPPTDLPPIIRNTGEH